MQSKSDRIRELNDNARTSWGLYGKVFFTNGIRALSEADQSAIAERVQQYGGPNPNTPEDDTIRDPWVEGDNPYGENDFGVIVHECEDGESVKVYFKFDYYDQNMEYGSEDPSDPRQTTRVLTIMLASEY